MNYFSARQSRLHFVSRRPSSATFYPCSILVSILVWNSSPWIPWVWFPSQFSILFLYHWYSPWIPKHPHIWKWNAQCRRSNFITRPDVSFRTFSQATGMQIVSNISQYLPPIEVVGDRKVISLVPTGKRFPWDNLQNKAFVEGRQIRDLDSRRSLRLNQRNSWWVQISTHSVGFESGSFLLSNAGTNTAR